MVHNAHTLYCALSFPAIPHWIAGEPEYQVPVKRGLTVPVKYGSSQSYNVERSENPTLHSAVPLNKASQLLQNGEIIFSVQISRR